MDLTQLRYFCDVARTQHMTRSAQRLHVAQPALTRAVHRLEDELGTALFEHAGRNIRLTPAGAYLLAQTEPILEQVDGLPGKLRAFAGEQARTVRVAALSASGVVVDAIAAFLADGGDASFEMVQQGGEGRWDVRVDTVLPGAARAGQPTVAASQRFREAIGVAVPLGSSFAGPVPLEALADERFICLAGSRRFRSLCDGLCAAQGFAPAVAFDSDDPAVVKKMIGLGLGVGFWPERTWGSLEGSGARWLPLADARFERTLEASLARPGAPGDAAPAFYGFLTETLGALRGACWHDAEHGAPRLS